MVHYINIFLVAFSTLTYEILLVRLFSLITWYHLAFLALSLGLLGLTAGGIYVFLKRESFSQKKLMTSLAWHSSGLSLAFVLLTLALCYPPVIGSRATRSLVIAIWSASLAWVPFFFAGVVITALLTKTKARIGWLYATDLIGAAAGCLLVLGALKVTDTPSLMLFCGAIAGLASLLFSLETSDRKQTVLAGFSLLLALGLGLANSPSGRFFEPQLIKGLDISLRPQIFSDWNSFSRVVVYEPKTEKINLWGPSPITPAEPISQYLMDIDGLAGTSVTPEAYSSLLKYDVTNFAYHIKSGETAAIIGVGGGRDIQAARSFGFSNVLGIELNSIFADLHSTLFRGFSGVATDPSVRLVVEDARSHMAGTDESFDIVQMSLIDTWAATGAGAFSLSENGLYTVEAWTTFLDRLKPGGIFTVSRWYSPDNVGETGRMMSLAHTTLLERKVELPEEHIALVGTSKLATLLISDTAFSEEYRRRIMEKASYFEFDILAMPGKRPANKALRSILYGEPPLSEIAGQAGLNFSAPRDENPYFFNMLSLSSALYTVVTGKDITGEVSGNVGVVRGNLEATKTLAMLLLVLLAFAILILLFPLFWSSETRYQVQELHLSKIIFFALIGSGFMFVEIGLIQRLSTYLGHPVYALGIILFTVILSTGIGSLFSELIGLERRRLILSLPLMTVGLIIFLALILPQATEATMHLSILQRASLSVASLAPVGCLMGMYFPLAMRLEQRNGDVLHTPWFFAINGNFGVLTSVLAVCIAIELGISFNLWLAAGLYGLTLPCLAKMQQS